MAHYLSEQTCKIEKKHYSVLLTFVQEWEDTFWTDGKQEQERLAFSARVYAGIALFRAYNDIAANTLEHLYRKELEQMNPLLAWNAELATKEIRETAELALKKKLDADPGLLFSAAPELRSRLEQCKNRFTAVMNEMLTRIEADREEINEDLFNGRDMGQILALDGSGADRHNHGRFTCIVTAESGKFIYRPHPVKADALLYDMTASFFSDTVILPKVVDRGDYGYAEFICPSRAEGTDAAAAFFRRLGGVSVLFQVFGSTDFHAENILAAGEYPALVDLETFIGFPWTIRAETMFFPLPEESNFLKDYSLSIAFSALLPHRVNEKETSPLLSRGDSSVLPIVDGEAVDVREYFSVFSAGFRDIYRRCTERKTVLLDYLEKLSGCSFRCLLRNTDAYAKLLQQYYSVPILASETAAGNLTDTIRRAMSNGADERQREQNAAIAEAELKALLEGDIPMFHCRADSRALYAGDEQVCEDYLPVNPADSARKRIERLSEEECEFELGIIRQSLETAHIALKDAPRHVRLGTHPAEPFVSFADEAEKVFEALWKKRVAGPSGEFGWLDHREDGSSFGYLPLSYGMGQGGIVAFAAEYYNAKKDERAAEIIRSFMQTAMCCVRRLREARRISANPGEAGVTGIAGSVRAMLMAAEALNCPEYRDCACTLTSLLDKVPMDQSGMKDYYSGFAGSLYLLCNRPELHYADGYERIVRKLTDQLLDTRMMETSFGIRTWDCIRKKRPVSGLGHGTAGIGLALAAAQQIFPDDNELCEAVQAAFNLEHALYSEKLKTWPDFRASGVAASYMHGFCSGAPGMGMVYLKLRDLGLTGWEDDLENAIQKCLATELMPRDHYCCGNPASIEFLLDAGRKLDRPELTEEGRKRLQTMCERASSRGEYTFLPAHYENFTPVTLLNGLSGIGHVLLKADDGSLPCLLL